MKQFAAIHVTFVILLPNMVSIFFFSLFAFEDGTRRAEVEY
jgi:hypothetical protein